MQTSDSDQRLAKGTIIGPYEIIRLLGKGGMGEVYEAYEAKLFRKVALKIISEEVLHNFTVLEHFLSEGRTLAQLNHPNVVTIYQLGEDNGVQFIAMEYIEGQSLDELIESKLPTAPEAIFIFYKILSGVQALHNKGIVHRDLKPKNIMVPNSKTIKIVDFGIAEFIVNNSATKEKSHTPKGSIYYLAPEILEGRPATIQSDIWSLGVIFYNLLTGLKPFVGADRSEIRESILRGKIYYSMGKRMGIPNNIIKMINKMCALDLDKRYKSIDEIITDLKTKTEQPKNNFPTAILAVGLAFLTTFPLVWQWSNLNTYKKSHSTNLSSSEKNVNESSRLTEEKKQIPAVASEPIVTPEKGITPQSLIEKNMNQSQMVSEPETLEIKPKLVETNRFPKVAKEVQLKSPTIVNTELEWLIQFKKSVNTRGIASQENIQSDAQKLSWKKVAGASSYKLQIAYDKAFKEIAVEQEVNKNFFTWEKPKLGIFFWRVQAVSKDKKASSFSRPGNLAVRVPAPTVNNKKIKVVLDATSKKKEVSLQWLGMSLVNAYEVRFTPVSGNIEKTKIISTETSISFPVEKKSKFKAHVVALNDKRKPASTESEEILVEVQENIFVPSPVLVYPLNRTIVPSQSTMITPIVCKWNQAKNAKKYVYQISEDKEGKKILNEVTVTENKMILTLPLSKGEYFWRVKTITQDDYESQWSNRFSFIVD